MDAAGYDAQAIGNREFHYLFALLRARASRMHYPAGLHEFAGRQRESATVSCRPCVSEAGGNGARVRVHVLGLLVMQYRVGSPWERVFGWRFLEPEEAIVPYASALPDGDLLVVLSHLGLSLDRELAGSRAAHRFVARRSQPRHARSSRVYVGDGSDRPCGSVRAFRFAQRARVRCRRSGVFVFSTSRSCRYCGLHERGRVLFVTNGHGEAAIAERIALELLTFAPAARIDHLALVGECLERCNARRGTSASDAQRRSDRDGKRAKSCERSFGRAGLAHAGSQARFLRRARGERTMSSLRSAMSTRS